ncbi:MAG: class A beta-lactamase-related serine hydrolase [Myxococcaceae bacterium]|nr:MAG: class A beta-lactamase-related serine hydrolase [Myxococcaceae bacterium]
MCRSDRTSTCVHGGRSTVDAYALDSPPPSPPTPAVRTLLALCLAAAACSATPHPSTAAPTSDIPSADIPSTDIPVPPSDIPAAPPAADLSATLEAIRARHALPALAAAVYDADRPLAQGAVGLRAADQPDAPVTVDDRWHLGSDTKAMTATLVARLVERGTLRWDTTLAEAFPDEAATMRAAYRSVTLEQLLQHRGGVVGNLLARPAIWNALWTSTRPLLEQRRAFVGQVLALAPEVPVGTYLYSNAGYMLVGAALERATGLPWEDLMRTEVFTPLDMASCGFGAPATVDTTDAPWGHRTAGSVHTPVPPGPAADNPPALGPAGTVHCTLRDWARFAQLHLRGARRDPAPYLRPESFARLHTPPSGGDYALGWGVASRPWAGALPALTHQGSNTMFLCSVWVVPSRGRVLLVATNAGDDRASAAVEATLGALIPAWVPRD